MNKILGNNYTDKITGFTGTATGFCQYLSGCNQVLLVPKVAPDGSQRESQWFDVQRLEHNSSVEQVKLDNGPTPGFDKAAPKR